MNPRLIASTLAISSLFFSCLIPIPAIGENSEEPSAHLVHSFEPPIEFRGEGFGGRVAISGDHVFIGARWAEPPTGGSGIIFQYRLPGPEFVRSFVDPDPETSAEFGVRVHTDGEVVAISSPYKEIEGIEQGVVYLYDVDSGDLVRTFHSPHPTEGGKFGIALGIVGDRIYIAAHGNRTGGESAIPSGAIYAFDLHTQELIRTFENPEPDEGDQFGFGFVVEGNRLLASARLDDTLGEDTGSAYLFDTETGELIHLFRNPTPMEADERFGTGICLAAGKAVIGALNDTTNGVESGACYVFNAVTGELERTIYSPNAQAGGQFAASVAIGPLFVAGEPATGYHAGAPGHAYLFDPRTGDLLQEIMNPSSAPKDHFGNPTATDGSHVLVGAWGGTGGAYLYDVSEFISPTAPTVDVRPDEPTTLDDLICEATGSVEFDGKEVSYAYQWLIDGMEVEFDGFNPVTGPTLSHEYTARGQVVECRVTPHTDTQTGVPASDSVTILNAPPAAPVVRILPENPTPDDGLAVWIDTESVDPDGDTIVYLFEWFSSNNGEDWTRRPEVSGNLSPFFPGNSSISSIYTLAAEFWRVEVTPIEAHTLSKSRTSKGLPILGGKGSAETMILPDLDGDNTVGPDDLTLLLSIWHREKSELPDEASKMFFRDADPPESRIGLGQLWHVTLYGWGRKGG